MLNKSEARKRVLSHRKSLPDEAYCAFDHQISEYAQDIIDLLQNHFSISSHDLPNISFAAYLPQNHEPGSRKLLQILREHGVRIYCPVIPQSISPHLPPKGDLASGNVISKILHWALYNGRERSGQWNIPEPYPLHLANDSTFHAMIIPALSIDSQGNRLGRGGGFYDQTLFHCTMPKTILLGMCFTAELVRKNHTLAWKNDPWDIPVHYTISEAEGLCAIAEHKNQTT